tara:strand:- start:1364 stop:3232 length:1869 start_codon:yes stop_codon:yes gene_type:complete
MPLTKLQFAPGIDKQNTEYGAEGKWSDCDNVRFRYGLPEKIGGWSKITQDGIIGAVRAVLTYSSLDGVKYAVYGTNKKLYAYSENSYADISPIRASGTGNITQFAVTDESSTVIVTDASHGALIGDFVTIATVSAAVGGITQANLQREFEILTVPSTNTYTIEAPAAGTSTAAGATANASYQFNTGPATSLLGYGWGAGTWGDSTWDASREGLTGASGVLLEAGKWSLDNWGEDVLSQQFNGGLSYWDTSAGLSSNRSSVTEVSTAPTKTRLMLVSGDDRHVICLGTETTIGETSTQDSMFIRWSTQENQNEWTPSSVNTAGSHRLTAGNQIQAAVRSRGAILIWTDTALYQMQFIGPPLTFGFKQLGSNCGAVGLNAAVDVNGIAYWMGNDSFFLYDGAVKKIPCSVQDHVFDSISPSSLTEVYCASNADYNEVMWFYADSTSNVINKQVVYNYLENLWYVGSLDRTTWSNSSIYSVPYASQFVAGSSATSTPTVQGLKTGRSFIYAQETGTDDDGSAMVASIESGDIDIGEGDNFMSIRRILPDFKNQVGNVDITMQTRPYPSATQTTHGPFEITTSTTKKDTRIRGRQLSLKLESNATGENWRYGTLRVDMQPDGERGS